MYECAASLAFDTDKQTICERRVGGWKDVCVSKVSAVKERGLPYVTSAQKGEGVENAPNLGTKSIDFADRGHGVS